MIRRMKTEDVDSIVDLHLQAFPGFFLSFLGKKFLSALYIAINTDPSGIVFIVTENGSVIGFVVGTDQPSGLYTRLLRKHLFSFAFASIHAVVRKPSILPRLLRAFTMPKQELPAPCCGTLMSIAVSPQAQGKGVGQMLVKAFLEEAQKRKLEHVNLTTDRDNNDSTNRFYQRLGFQLHRSYITPEGRHMNEYLIITGKNNAYIPKQPRSI